MDYLLANNSGCSGGGGQCESGWTLYLDNSFVSPSYYNNNSGFREEKGIILKNGAVEEEEEEEEGEEEEEDLSMVSDASSGPPQYFAEEEESNCCFYSYNAPLIDTTAAAFCKNSGKNIKKVKEKRVHDQHQPSSLLDDTASSPVFDISHNNFTTGNNHESSGEENVSDFSQGYSTTHFEESSAYQHQHQYGFFQSSLSGNYLQKNQWFQGRR